MLFFTLTSEKLRSSIKTYTYSINSYKQHRDLKLQKEFSDYYQETSFNDITKNEIISGSGSYYIHNTLFTFHYRNRAVYLNSNSKVLLETCTFYNNSVKGRGGSFYIENSECIIVHICVSSSTVSSLSGSAYCIVSNDNNRSYAFECSVSQCSGYEAAFYHQKGDIQVSNMNTSYHNIKRIAAYGIQWPDGTGIINFTTASNTSSSEAQGIYHEGTLHSTYCNYLNNECRETNNAIFYCRSKCKYSKCSFIENKGTYLFRRKPEIENCYFAENTFERNVHYDESFTLESFESFNSSIVHYSTDGCSATYTSKIHNTLSILTYRNSRFRILRR
ncbi:hypothetical protein TVAG_457700 [Trichomonas vaginalis G3]|uniref:Right handed beta helix domain-containing protein n=1 Tax=Trichomonas vaginalis (strain ATCC PRA-98 / G3) TaxID=412133 RepID=A2G981_TRIV3|nr:pectin lyase-like family [Trichomonas vaginalis G3]EAX86288.1 hypothetical protein TVAG_457700 [Trichomonas vaginalis G3]KAI5511061.1 pectin lyase-like family [Trichomonas vaginalis G3]|eukprot:XP_001299218.1 hypothetical protein [Trichomonas vaginalis G3]